MAGHDYTMKLTDEKGTVKEYSYQALITALEIKDEVVHGAPLSAGGTPQAAFLAGALKKRFKDLKSVEVFFNGSRLL